MIPNMNGFVKSVTACYALSEWLVCTSNVVKMTMKVGTDLFFLSFYDESTCLVFSAALSEIQAKSNLQAYCSDYLNI